MREISRTAIVEHRAADLYAIVEDVASYPRFLPWCLAADVLERSESATLARLAVGIRALRQSFTTRNANHAPESIDIRLVEGPFRHFHARWEFVPLAERATRIMFRMEYEFSNAAVATALGPLFAHIADSMVEAFLRRADERHGGAVR